MMEQLRRPARTPPPALHAPAWDTSPMAAVQQWFEGVLAERMSGLPFLNPALSVHAFDFRHVEGDWLGGVVTPWSVQLMLLPGGGELWTDTPAGSRSLVTLPVGTLPFIADEGDARLPAFQYFPLLNTVTGIADEQAARALVQDALATACQPPAAATGPAPADTPASPPPVDTSRRRFLRFGGTPAGR